MAKLFDKSIMGYIVKEANWDLGSGPIYDQAGTQVGQMDQKIISLRKDLKFKEMDGSVSARLSRKLIAAAKTYELFDAQDKPLAKIVKAIISFKPKFVIKDDKKNVIFTVKGKFMGFDFNVYKGKTNQIVAEIHKIDKWKDQFFKGVWDKSDTYGVKIHDAEVDRRFIIGATITIDNTLHDK
jgi:uncharacterized protein YxjI